MADQIDLIITLRKTVPTEPAARTQFETVKQYFSDQPEITVTGHTTTHYDTTEDPPT